MITITESYNPFGTRTTIPKYDDALDDPDHFKSKYNRKGSIEYMTPKEYIQMCADMWNKSYDSVYQSRAIETKTIEKYKQMMEDGVKFHLPYICTVDKAQEGIHRMICAGDLYGWDSEFPVLVVTVADQEREDQESVKDEIKHIVLYLDDWRIPYNLPDILTKASDKFNGDLNSKTFDYIDREFNRLLKAEEGYKGETLLTYSYDLANDNLNIDLLQFDGNSIPKGYDKLYNTDISEWFDSVDGKKIEKPNRDNLDTDNIDDLIDYDMDFDEFQKTVDKDDNVSDAIMKHFFKK